VFIVPITQFELGDKEPWHFPQKAWWYQSLAHDFH
jgi:hypothetical protein